MKSYLFIGVLSSLVLSAIVSLSFSVNYFVAYFSIVAIIALSIKMMHLIEKRIVSEYIPEQRSGYRKHGGTGFNRDSIKADFY